MRAQTGVFWRGRGVPTHIAHAFHVCDCLLQSWLASCGWQLAPVVGQLENRGFSVSILSGPSRYARVHHIVP